MTSIPRHATRRTAATRQIIMRVSRNTQNLCRIYLEDFIRPQLIEATRVILMK